MSSQPAARRPFITVAQKYIEAVKRFGLRDCFWKFYNCGDIKFGYKVGEDRFGNEYFHDPTDSSGQQRWCEFTKTFAPIDASQIPPEWHMWLQQITDDIPAKQDPTKWPKVPIATVSHAPYSNHLGPVNPDAYTQNQSGFHSRGYGVGSLFLSPDAPDNQYVQPHHALRSRRRTTSGVNTQETPSGSLRDPSLP